jgi:phage FluMu protein Com
MPIRFRCKHCDQLLGIARRKAGSLVKCPTCRNEVLVPHQDEEEAAPQAPAPSQPPPPNLFDREDFDVLLAGGGGRGGGALAPPQQPSKASAPSGAPAAGSWSSYQPGAPSAPPGSFVLSAGRATLLAVVFVLMLAVSFVAGLLVGRFVL